MKHHIKKIVFLAALALTATVSALEVGQNAPCVVLDHTQNGKDSTHCIREPQVENKPVVIEFFSITCSDCQSNLPQILNLAKALEGKATVRFVSVDRNEALVREYIANNNIQLEVAFDTHRDARNAYKVSVTPTLFVLDKSNTVIEKHTGVLSNEDLTSIISKIERL